MNKIPKRLMKEPLIEAIWQVQFEPPAEQPIGDLLPGMLYSALRDTHPKLQLHRLPTADIPAQVAQLDPNLRYIAKYRMEEAGLPFLYQVGDHTVTLNCRKPYVGWNDFKEKTLALIDILDKSGFIPVPTRHSLRYIDLLDLEPAPDLSSLQIKIEIGGLAMCTKPLQMRIELPEDDCLHVVQLATPVQAALPWGVMAGSVVDLETLPISNPKSWQDIRDQLDHLHDRSKHLFFAHILTQQAIERLEPEY